MKYYFSRVETALSGHPDNSPVRPASETRAPLNIAIDQAWCLNGYGYNSIAGRHHGQVPSNSGRGETECASTPESTRPLKS